MKDCKHLKYCNWAKSHSHLVEGNCTLQEDYVGCGWDYKYNLEEQKILGKELLENCEGF